MVVPLAARYVACAVGVLLVVTSASSVIGTLIVPRSVASWLTRRVDHWVAGAYVLITKPVRDFKRRDRILATHAATLLLCQIIAWLVMFFVGFALIFWPLTVLIGPGSVVFALMTWKRPLSLVRRSRWRFVLAILIGLAETIGWIWLILYSWEQFKMGLNGAR